MDKREGYYKGCFIDFCSALNTTDSFRLIIKFIDQGQNSSLCSWIYSFLIGQLLVVRDSKHISISFYPQDLKPVFWDLPGNIIAWCRKLLSLQHPTLPWEQILGPDYTCTYCTWPSASYSGQSTQTYLLTHEHLHEVICCLLLSLVIIVCCCHLMSLMSYLTWSTPLPQLPMWSACADLLWQMTILWPTWDLHPNFTSLILKS